MYAPGAGVRFEDIVELNLVGGVKKTLWRVEDVLVKLWGGEEEEVIMGYIIFRIERK